MVKNKRKTSQKTFEYPRKNTRTYENPTKNTENKHTNKIEQFQN